MGVCAEGYGCVQEVYECVHRVWVCAQRGMGVHRGVWVCAQRYMGVCTEGYGCLHRGIWVCAQRGTTTRHITHTRTHTFSKQIKKQLQSGTTSEKSTRLAVDTENQLKEIRRSAEVPLLYRICSLCRMCSP